MQGLAWVGAERCAALTALGNGLAHGTYQRARTRHISFSLPAAAAVVFSPDMFADSPIQADTQRALDFERRDRDRRSSQTDRSRSASADPSTCTSYFLLLYIHNCSAPRHFQNTCTSRHRLRASSVTVLNLGARNRVRPVTEAWLSQPPPCGVLPFVGHERIIASG